MHIFFFNKSYLLHFFITLKSIYNLKIIILVKKIKSYFFYPKIQNTKKSYLKN